MPRIADIYEPGMIKSGTTVETGKRVLIPDIVLRDAYNIVANRVGSAREKFVAETRNIEDVFHLIGPMYGHVSIDWVRARIPNCCKNPEKHGGWWNVFGGIGPSIGSRGGGRVIDELLSCLISLRKKLADENARHLLEMNKIEQEIANVIDRNTKNPRPSDRTRAS